MNGIVNVEKVDKYLRQQNMSKTKFCKECVIDIKTLNKIYVNNINYGIKVLFKIARQLNISVKELLE